MYNYSTSSGVKTATTQIYSGPGALIGIDVIAPDTGHVVITIYDSGDSTTANRTIVSQVSLDAGLQGLTHEYFIPVGVVKGLYATLANSGTGTPSFIVRYTPG